jgi:hypothetical protein
MSYLCYLHLFAYSGVHYTVLLIETSSVDGRNTCIAIYPYAHYIFNVSMTCSAWIKLSNMDPYHNTAVNPGTREE